MKWGGGGLDVHETFQKYFKKLRKNGVYIVEQSGNRGALIGIGYECFLDFIDYLNARANTLDTDFAAQTFCLAFYRNHIVIEKRIMNADAVRAEEIPLSARSKRHIVMSSFLHRIGLLIPLMKIIYFITKGKRGYKNTE